jgi:hypothetical protein
VPRAVRATRTRRQLRGEIAQRALAALGTHRRDCHVCRAAPTTGNGMCEQGRELLYAAQAALKLTEQA